MTPVKKSIKHFLSDVLTADGVYEHLYYMKNGEEYLELARIDKNYRVYAHQLKDGKPIVEVVSNEEVAEFFDDILVLACSSGCTALTPIAEVNEEYIDQLELYADDWYFVHVFDDGYYFSMLGNYELSNMPEVVTHVEEVGR
jgi:hypothetical protein